MTDKNLSILQFWAYRQLQSWLKTQHLLQNFISYTKTKNLWKYVHQQVRNEDSVRRIFVDAFWWKETEEGYTFWYRVNLRWVDFINTKARGVYFFKSQPINLMKK